MKKRILLILLLVSLQILAGCKKCEHQWKDATCNRPKTCSLCDAQEGETLGHNWQDADCISPKTCPTCQKTVGDPLGHTWTGATCTEAKHCSVCDAVEGEALGHDYLAPNFQNPAICRVCGHGEGQVVPPAYDSYPVKVIQVAEGVEYDYVAACYIKGNTTVGKLSWENYEVFAYDETHGEVEGYLWHRVTVKIVFSDKNAQRYGFVVQSALDDYFWIAGESNNGYTDGFTVSFHGQLYDQCLLANRYATVTNWIDGSCTYTAEFAWRVPVGYDGHLILFYNAHTDLQEALSSGDETLLAFRFTA